MVSSKPKSKAIFRFIYEGFLNCTLEELYSLEDWPVYFYHSSRARKPEDKTIFHQNLRTDFAKFLSGFKMSQASFMARAENGNEEEFNQLLVDQISLISDEDVLVLAKSEFMKSPAMCTLPKEFFQAGLDSSVSKVIDEAINQFKNSLGDISLTVLQLAGVCGFHISFSLVLGAIVARYVQNTSQLFLKQAAK